MPLYEYRCEACDQPEEKLESLSAPESHACPACGAALGMKRQMSVAAFSLSGGGWYKGAASEPAPSTPATSTSAAATSTTPAATTSVVEAPKSSHACGTGGCSGH